jgi:diacylglycerol O-acyltransferase
LGPDPEWRPAGPSKWLPRRAPSGTRLFVEELQKRVLSPLTAMGAAGRALADAGGPIAAAKGIVEGLQRNMGGSLSPASESPFNAELGPHRRFDWTQCEMEAIQEIRKARGGKLNDVVLTVVAGAVNRFLKSRGLQTRDLDFRVMVPVSLRTESERGSLGNRVFQMTIKLPVPEPDPLERLEQVTATTSEQRDSAQGVGSATLDAVADTLGAGLLTSLAQLGLQARAANVVTTNVPGPPMPVYMLGARMLAAYPVVPLGGGQTLGIALFSYAGTLYWGLNADWDAMPDLHDFAEAIEEEFAILHKAATA